MTVRRAVLAVAAGVAIYFLPGLLPESATGRWRFVLAVAVGCAALIVQELRGSARRLGAMEESVAGIDAAVELLTEVDRPVLRSRTVARLARAHMDIRDQGPDLVQAFAEMESARHTTLLESLAAGRAECAGEAHDWLIGLTDRAEHTVRATSTSLDRDFWTSDPGQRYLLAQRQAARGRGVEIRRLFVVDEESEVTEDLKRQCDFHGALGIDVRIAVVSELGPGAWVTALHDFVVFDGVLSCETAPDLRGVPVRTTLNARPGHVQERISRFEELWEVAAPAPDRWMK
ncbi:DUF6879 family protein [Streptomyces luteogriseus]|uniref:DUF6879 family protein n=1 Tax=Streptomyces luteogriseus TaxID=68233 RepID=UPI0037A402A4